MEENAKMICKGCPAAHYCDAPICKRYHCGFSTLMGFDDFKLNCEDNDLCVIKAAVSFIMEVAKDPRYEVPAKAVLSLYNVELVKDESKSPKFLEGIWNNIKGIWRRKNG